MVINLKDIIINYDEKDVMEQNEDVKEVNGQKVKTISKIPLTLKSVFIQAINSNLPMEVRTPEELMMADGLNVKIYSSDEVDLTPADMEYIKDRVAKIWSMPIVYKRVKEFFSPNN